MSIYKLDNMHVKFIDSYRKNNKKKFTSHIIKLILNDPIIAIVDIMLYYK